MHITGNAWYLECIEKLHSGFPYWEKMEGKTIFLSGASGMIGSFLVDAVMLRNRELPPEKRTHILGFVRNLEKAKARFVPWLNMAEFRCIQHDICEPLPALPRVPDYWIHAASTTHPVAYASEPVNTIFSNVLGTKNILEKAAESRGRFLFLSSVEIYGENRGDTEYFAEKDCGYIDCNTLRAGYPEAKRVSEAMCQAYSAQFGVDTVILRLPRCYGPTMQMTDSKAVAQFIKKAVAGEDIVLKSEGKQLYSYAHVADAACGLLWVLLAGKSGEAYNLADEKSDITLKKLAELTADCVGKNVVFDLPNEAEKRGFSKAQKALLDGRKLESLGWQPAHSIQDGIPETIKILRECAYE